MYGHSLPFLRSAFFWKPADFLQRKLSVFCSQPSTGIFWIERKYPVSSGYLTTVCKKFCTGISSIFKQYFFETLSLGG